MICLLSAATNPALGTPVINEFLASNEDGLTLASWLTPDWIEIYNPGPETFDLSGWSLTTDPLSPDQWTFPAGTTLAAGAYRLVYATGEDLRDPAGELHTNFKLGQDGEYLAFVDPTEVAQQEFSPLYPEQYPDVSFGFPTGQTEPAYFTVPTPGEVNNQSIQGFVKDTSFSVKRGFFESEFQVAITTTTPGASIFYTLDGSDPGPSSATVAAPDPATPPVLTLDISTTTIVRAYAAKPGFQKTNTDTQTYLFLDEVISNPVMATSVTNHAVWGPQMRDALLEIPTISLVTQDPIPTQPIMSPPEIPVSIEMIFPDGRDGFQLDAGAERFGGQYTVYDKHALRISFKEIYGKKKLKFDLFSDTPYGGDTAVESFDQILLRNGSHDSLFATNYPHSRGVYVRNRYFFDRQLEAGHLSMRGKFVHVYLNGTYYGHHHLMERPNADFMATHLGGEEEDYDIMKGRDRILVSQGEVTAWNYLNANKTNYEVVKDYMDIDSYIDYMLLNFYGGNDHDWYPQHNWVAGRKREAGGKFRFFMWDNDFLVRRGGNSTTGSTANTTDNGGPGNMLSALVQHPEFKMRLADRTHKHFFNGGMLTKERVQADFTELSQRISRTIIPETARWGTKAEQLYTPSSFQTYVDWIVNVNAETRSDVVLGQMRTERMLPGLDAPSFNQHGGEVPSGFSLQVSHPAGDLYYTTDGSDPRLPGGAINPTATMASPFASVIEAGSDWKYDDTGADFGTSWQTASFSDSSWPSGPAPLGFGNIDDNKTIIATQTNPGAPKQLTVYYRKTFQVNNAATVSEGQIGLHADDGAVVYLNGVEIHRENMPAGTITRDTPASGGGNEGVFDLFTFDGSSLVEGENLICVEIHNSNAFNNDMVFDLELGIQSSTSVPINETSQVMARVYDGTEWSALNEAIFITDEPASAANLVISEIHYHPSIEQGEDSEFIELMNISSQSINLAGVSFTEGISFRFSEQTSLPAGGRIVLAFDPLAFEAAYGNTIPVGGIYTSRLANNGERITLSAADGSIIQTVRYNDKEPWPTIADGIGYSLVLVAPTGVPNPELPQNWRASIEPGGSPAASDSTPFAGSTSEDLLIYATGGTNSAHFELVNGIPVFEYRRMHGADDAQVVVEVSSDLQTWTTPEMVFLGQENMPNDAAKMRFVLPPGDGTRVFARISVSVVP